MSAISQLCKVLPLSQIIRKTGSKKIDVFGPNFDQYLLRIWDRGSIELEHKLLPERKKDKFSVVYPVL
jgi:hypothetical protein